MALYVREAGSRGAPTIVFLHGGPLSSVMWLPQFERLADYRCLAPDLPEQGKSADIGPFTLEDAAQRVAELIRERVPGGRRMSWDYRLVRQWLCACFAMRRRLWITYLLVAHLLASALSWRGSTISTSLLSAGSVLSG